MHAASMARIVKDKMTPFLPTLFEKLLSMIQKPGASVRIVYLLDRKCHNHSFSINV
jgi:hypothetical protein